jgi:hypothetical protein
LLTLVLVASCGPDEDQGAASFGIAGVPMAIPGAVTTPEAIDLLTETTLGCVQVEDRQGLDQWVCRADNSAGSGGARLTVSLLAEGDELRLIHAEAEGGADAGEVEGVAPFFIETVIARLTPQIAAEPDLAAWVTNQLDSAGTAEFAGSQVHIRLAGRTVGLQMYGAP